MHVLADVFQSKELLALLLSSAYRAEHTVLLNLECLVLLFVKVFLELDLLNFFSGFFCLSCQVDDRNIYGWMLLHIHALSMHSRLEVAFSLVFVDPATVEVAQAENWTLALTKNWHQDTMCLLGVFDVSYSQCPSST